LADVGKGGFKPSRIEKVKAIKFGLTLFAVAQKSAASSSMIICAQSSPGQLGGGGTDLPSYLSDHTGFLVAAAIDKYVYIILTKDSPRFPAQVFPHGGSFFR